MEHNMFCFQCEQTAGCSGCMGTYQDIKYKEPSEHG